MTYITLPKRSRHHVESLADLVETFFGEHFHHSSSDLMPALTLSEDNKTVYVELETPGFNKDDITIDYRDGILMMSGEKKDQVRREDERVIHTEVRTGSFNRKVRVGDINFKKAEASLRDGLLKVILPKQDETKSSTLRIS